MRTRKDQCWCLNAMSTTLHPHCTGIGYPGWEGGGIPELCEECEQRRSNEDHQTNSRIEEKARIA